LNGSQPPLLAAFEAEGTAAVATLRPALDVSYGPHPRQRFDFFTAGTPAGTIAYFHAGYWQSRDKAQFRFLAPFVTGEGFNLAVVNYPLCPDVTVADLTEAVRDAVPAILSFAERAQGTAGRLVAMDIRRVRVSPSSLP
jgi:arylformamidase